MIFANSVLKYLKFNFKQIEILLTKVDQKI